MKKLPVAEHLNDREYHLLTKVGIKSSTGFD